MAVRSMLLLSSIWIAFVLLLAASSSTSQDDQAAKGFVLKVLCQHLQPFVVPLFL